MADKITPWVKEEELTSDRMNLMVGEANQIDTSTKNSLEAHKAEKASDDVHGLKYKNILLGVSAVALSVPNNSPYIIPWSQIDGEGWWSEATKIVIPDGVSKVRLKGSVHWAGNANGYRRLYIQKNGQIGRGFGGSQIPSLTSDWITQQCSSSAISVVPGDYFQLCVEQTSGAALNIASDWNATAVWFELEVIE